MHFLTLLTLLLPFTTALPAPQEDTVTDYPTDLPAPTATADATLTLAPEVQATGLVWPSCPVLERECTPGAWQGANACGLRATCETFDPLDHPSNYGRHFCVCQAGYRASNAPWWAWWYQHRMSWINARGNQTHRVFVKPQVACEQLCNESGGDPRDCDEVPVLDFCR